VQQAVIDPEGDFDRIAAKMPMKAPASSIR
jgi:hypothetical protein